MTELISKVSSGTNGTTTNLLTVENVEVRYQGTILALKGVSLSVGRGEIVGVLGPNGAGKSTALRAVSNLLKAQKGEVTDGSISFDGADLQGLGPTETVRRGIVQVLEGRRVLEHMTVEQNLKVAAVVKGLGGKETASGIADIYGMFPDLARYSDAPAAFLSGGQQQMLVLGRALICRPTLLLLDEPSLGLSPVITKQIFRVIKDLNGDGLTILVVEQNAHHTLGVADRGYVLESGRIVLEGTADELEANDDLREFYLGLNREGDRRSFVDGKHYKRRKRWLG
jgi:branched-chain amino acid transport system ATP-binding protein